MLIWSWSYYYQLKYHNDYNFTSNSTFLLLKIEYLSFLELGSLAFLFQTSNLMLSLFILQNKLQTLFRDLTCVQFAISNNGYVSLFSFYVLSITSFCSYFVTQVNLVFCILEIFESSILVSLFQCCLKGLVVRFEV